MARPRRRAGRQLCPAQPAPPRALTGLTASWIAPRADCLTAAIYYEAASEPDDGQRAVAQVVLNRVAHPAYPKTVCGVVYQGSERGTGCQFTFTCDGALARKPSRYFWDRAAWRARRWRASSRRWGWPRITTPLPCTPIGTRP
jgi:spore germination cell wall hydrolase CwlJ-like protein